GTSFRSPGCRARSPSSTPGCPASAHRRGSCRCLQSLPRSVSHGQAFFAVNSADALGIHQPSLPPKHHRQAPIPEPTPLPGQLLQSLAELRVLALDSGSSTARSPPTGKPAAHSSVNRLFFIVSSPLGFLYPRTHIPTGPVSRGQVKGNECTSQMQFR